MNRFASFGLIALASLAQTTLADAVKPAELLDNARHSVVVVQFTYDGEVGKRDFSGMATVIREDGLAIYSLDLAPRALPDAQMTDFKIILPGDPEDEIDAEFLGRDERYGISYIKPKDKGDHKWAPVEFVDKPVAIGDTVHSIGILPKMAGYNLYYSSAEVSAILRGPIPQVLVGGSGLTVIGSPVFNDAGEAVGLVNSQPDRTVLLNDPRAPYATVENPTRLFTPSRDFLASLKSPPKSGDPLKLAFAGVTSLTGLSKDVAEFYGLKGKVAIQIGDVIPGFAADLAGLKKGDIIVTMNGEPLERGDLPEENPAIFTRKLSQMNVGDKVTLGIISEKGAEPRPVEVTLSERPAQANKADRFYAEDLGFTTRDVVFEDTYARKLAKDAPGVVVTFIRPQSAAQAAQLGVNDFVQLINQTPVKDVKQFEEAYDAFRKDKPNEAVVLEVLRGGNTQIIRIEPPRE
jgi:S1-C subfamily serine protease